MRPISVGSKPTAATLTTLYTVPLGYYAKFATFLAVNEGSGNKYITLEWYDASEAQAYQLLYQIVVNAKNYLLLGLPSYIVLEEGDILQVETESASTFSVIATLEIDGSQRA
jgi:hypothetical protein